MLYEAKSLIPGSPASVNVNLIVAPAAPLYEPVPLPVIVGAAAPLEHCAATVKHDTDVRASKWKRLAAGIPFDIEAIGKCVDAAV